MFVVTLLACWWTPAPEPHSSGTRVAFGSCADQRVPQPIWTAVLDSDPDAFVFLGDNVYADTRDPEVMAEAYADLARIPGFRALRDSDVVVFATWDDHDYGENDADAAYPMRVASEAQFEAFWGGNERRQRPGVYDVGWIESMGHRVQILLLDLRSFRSAMIDQERTPTMKVRGIGPYLPRDDGTLLGADQWAWLEAQLAQPADLRLIASSLPVIAEGTGWEVWANLPAERERLLALLQVAGPVVVISGDTHWGAISSLGTPTGPLVDITSSGLTKAWPLAPPQVHRVGPPFTEANFGVVDITWETSGPEVEVQIRDVQGRMVRSADLSW